MLAVEHAFRGCLRAVDHVRCTSECQSSDDHHAEPAVVGLLRHQLGSDRGGARPVHVSEVWHAAARSRPGLRHDCECISAAASRPRMASSAWSVVPSGCPWSLAWVRLRLAMDEKSCRWTRMSLAWLRRVSGGCAPSAPRVVAAGAAVAACAGGAVVFLAVVHASFVVVYLLCSLPGRADQERDGRHVSDARRR